MRSLKTENVWTLDEWVVNRSEIWVRIDLTIFRDHLWLRIKNLEQDQSVFSLRMTRCFGACMEQTDSSN
jgi:hypothetical protein